MANSYGRKHGVRRSSPRHPPVAGDDYPDIGGLLNADTGRAIAQALDHPRQWRFRKIDSIRLMEGRVGRRRVSADVMPPADPALAYYSSDRRRKRIEQVIGPVLVPLAMMTKEPLRNFDLGLSDGETLPVLSRADNARAAAAAVLYEIGGDMAFRNSGLVDAVMAVVEGPPSTAQGVCDELLRVGTYKGTRVLFPGRLSSLAEALLEELSKQFLLVALLPSHLAGTRCLVKYSFHWDCTFDVKGERLHLIFGACGYTPVRLDIDIPGAPGYASYHLEVHVPTGLESCELRLPTTTAGRNRWGNQDAGSATQDARAGVIAHSLARYTDEPNGAAELYLQPPRDGLRRTAAWVTCLTALTFLAIGYVPGTLDRFLDAQDSGSALLLAAPAVVISFLTRTGENAIASTLLAPLRAMMWACVGAFAGAAGLVVAGSSGWPMTCFWRLGALTAASLSMFILVGYIVSGRRQTGRRKGTS